MKGFFVAGTDTDAGKTLITAALTRNFRRLGRDAVPMKVVQTGGGYGADGIPVSQDFDVYCEASSFLGEEGELRDMVPYSFTAPCSPHLAARMDGGECKITPIVEALGRLCARHELVVAEGVGGVNVPLSGTQTCIDLMGAMELPIVLVIRNTLGCINHALNTIGVLRARGLEIRGAVMTQTAPSLPEDAFILEDNPRIIEGIGNIPVLGAIPFVQRKASDPDSFWKALDRSMAGIAHTLLNGGIG